MAKLLGGGGKEKKTKKKKKKKDDKDKQSKKQIKCFVKESFPHFLVTDGFFFVPCYFTRKAVDDFKAKFTNINITDLKK